MKPRFTAPKLGRMSRIIFEPSLLPYFGVSELPVSSGPPCSHVAREGRRFIQSKLRPEMFRFSSKSLVEASKD